MSKILVMAFLCISLNANSQAIKPLTIGDTVPDIQLDNIIHFKTTSTKLSEFKDKLVIIDFFATWCTGCIGAIPKIKEIQKKHKDSIVIFLVDSKNTGDTEKKIKSLFNKQPRLIMPTITRDTTLNKLFPHKIIPHYIWIKNGVVKAITSSKEITENNINKVILQSNKKIKIKNDFPNVHLKRSLFTDTAVSSAVIVHSILTKEVEGISSRSILEHDSTGLITRINYINLSLIALYGEAYPKLRSYQSNRIIRKTKLVNKEKKYCYGLKMPASTMSEFQNRMKGDLKKAFNLIIVEKTKLLNCFVIKQNGQVNKLFDTANLKPEANIYGYYTSRHLHNKPLKLLINALNTSSDKPVINETNINCPVRLDNLPANLNDIPAVNKALNKYGLGIYKEKRNIPVCIIGIDDKAQNSNK